MSPGPTTPPGPSSQPGPTATSSPAAATAAATQTASGQIAYLLYERQQLLKRLAATPTLVLTNNDVVLALYDLGIAISRALMALADELAAAEKAEPQP